MPTNGQLIATKAELPAARDAALAAVWAVFYVALALSRFAHQLGNPRESDWPYDEFGIEAEKTFRTMIDRRDALQELLTDRVLTALEEAKARAGDPMPVSVGDVQYPTYHRAAMERLSRFVSMLSVGRPLVWPSWVTVLRGTYDVTGPANAAERYAYYDSLIEDLMSFSFVSNGEETEGGIQDERARALEMETGIRCECARARAAAPDAEEEPGVANNPQTVEADPKMDKTIGEAIAIMARHPRRSLVDIATQVGIRRQLFYEHPTLVAARAAMDQGKATNRIPKGSSDAEGNIEATSPAVDWSEELDRDDVTPLDQVSE